MGIGTRIQKLMNEAKDETRKKDIMSAAARLVNPLGMGGEYKVMGVVPRMGRDGVVETEVYPFVREPEKGDEGSEKEKAPLPPS